MRSFVMCLCVIEFLLLPCANKDVMMIIIIILALYNSY